MDLRQDALRLRRAETAAARPALRPARRQAPARLLVRSLRRDRRQDRRSWRCGHGGDCRRPGRLRGYDRAQGPVCGLRFGEYRLPPGRGRRSIPAVRASYLFNSGIAGIDEADALVLIGANPRIEAAVLNARIRRRWRAGGFRIGLIGEAADLTYRTDHLGAGAETLAALAGGDHGFADVLGRAERPMLIVGPGVLARDDGAAMLGLARAAAERFGLVGDGWNGFNVLHTAASRVGGLDLRLRAGAGRSRHRRDPRRRGNGRDRPGLAARRGRDRHGAPRQSLRRLSGPSRRRRRGPGRRHPAGRGLYREKRNLCECRGPAPAHGACHLPARRRARGLDHRPRVLGSGGTHCCPTIRWPRSAPGWPNASPVFDAVDEILPAEWEAFGGDLPAGDPDPAPFRSPVQNYYMTDPIGRCSETMAQCTQMRRSLDAGARTGTDG